MPVPTIEWTLNLGTVAGLLFVAGGFYWTVRGDLKSMKDELKMLRVVVTEQAVQNTRLDNQDTLLTEMRREINQLREGRGFIQPRIDGEYPR